MDDQGLAGMFLNPTYDGSAKSGDDLLPYLPTLHDVRLGSAYFNRGNDTGYGDVTSGADQGSGGLSSVYNFFGEPASKASEAILNKYSGGVVDRSAGVFPGMQSNRYSAEELGDHPEYQQQLGQFDFSGADENGVGAKWNPYVDTFDHTGIKSGQLADTQAQERADLSRWGLDPNKQYGTKDFSSNPTSERGSRDNVSSLYEIGKDGTAKAIGARNIHNDSQWVSSGRPWVTSMAAMFAGGAAGAAFGGAGTAGGLATDATGATVSEGAAGAGYGASGMASQPSLLGSMGNGALKGGAINAGTTAVRGGDLNDILKAGATGAIGGAVGGAVSNYNPAGQVGVTDPTYQRLINNGVTSAGLTAARGGNVGTSLSTSALTGGLSLGLQNGAQFGNELFGDKPNMDTYSEDGGLGAYGGSYPSDSGGSLGDYMNNLRGYSSPAPGSQMGQFINAPLTSPDAQQPSMEYSPDLGGTPVFPTGSSAPKSSNPYKDMLVKALGVSNGMTQSTGTQGPANFDNMASNLMQLYQSRKNAKQYGGLADGLQGMYGQNSPYAQVLQQTLMRQDAAAGRRSQVGPRSVELQARLADMNSRNAPEIARLRASQQNNQGQQLQSLLRMGGGSLLQSGWRGLGGMFQPSGNMNGYNPASDYNYQNGSDLG